jgi:V-type H+-transporting ATPase subunit C
MRYNSGRPLVEIAG